MKTLIEAEKFTAWYDSAEDRLRVAINIDSPDARVDFWITRRFFLSLITQIEGLLDTQELGISKSEIDNMIQEGHPEPKSNDKTNEISKPQDESQESIETPKSIDAPKSEVSVSLLRNMDISLNRRENRVKLKLSSDCCEAEANLTVASMSAFIKMLILQAPTLEWGISSVMFHR